MKNGFDVAVLLIIDSKMCTSRISYLYIIYVTSGSQFLLASP